MIKTRSHFSSNASRLFISMKCHPNARNRSTVILRVFVSGPGERCRSRAVAIRIEDATLHGAAVGDVENRVTAWVYRTRVHAVFRDVSDRVDRSQFRGGTRLKRVCKLRLERTVGD